MRKLLCLLPLLLARHVPAMAEDALIRDFRVILACSGGLMDLGAKLKPAPGWKYRVAILDRGLTISTPQGYNWIVQDELQNTYDACKESACNFKP